MSSLTEKGILCVLTPILCVCSYILRVHDCIFGISSRIGVLRFQKKYGRKEIKGRVVTPLQKTQRHEFATIASRAFLEEGLNKHCCEDREIRRYVYYKAQLNIRYYFTNDRNALCYSISDNDPESPTDGLLKGVMFVTGPKRDMTLLSIIKFALLFFTKVRSFWKFKEMMSCGDSSTIMEDCKEKGYFRLCMLSVDPTSQGKGYGSELLNFLVDMADKENSSCCLETNSLENVKLYKKFGFEVKEECLFKDGLMTTYLMRRDPIGLLKKDE